MTISEIEELARLEREASERWILVNEYTGANWMVCSLGNSGIDGEDYHITTDRVHASEYHGDAKSDGELIVNARNALPRLLADWRRMREMLEKFQERLGCGCGECMCHRCDNLWGDIEAILTETGGDHD